MRGPSPFTTDTSHAALNALLLIFIFNFTFQPLTEPDFGWHLRNGLDVLAQGLRLPQTDPYSHTMPEWPWVEHAWLTDVIIGALYRQASGLAVIVLFGIVAAGAWLLASSTAGCSIAYRLVACILSLWVALPYLGTRTQLISLLGLAVLLVFLFRRRRNWWLIPAIFLLWANLHGGFMAGLLLLGLVATATWIVQGVLARWPRFSSRLDEQFLSQTELTRLGVVIATAAAVTFLNPYGWRLHEEILSSLSNQFMLATVQEWQPVSLATRAGRSFVIYLIGLFIAMVFWYRKWEPVRWTVLAAFLYLSLRHMRNIPIFLIVSLPLSAELLETAWTRLGSWLPPSLTERRRGSLAVSLAASLLLIWIGPEHLSNVVRSGVQPASYFKETSYPIEAVDWIKSHRDERGTRLYNDYGYGGFLLWWLPEEKIFIDGRMPAWVIGERKIFEDYIALTKAPPALSILSKYSVDWALVRRHSQLDLALEREGKWRRTYGDGKVSIYLLDRT